MAMHGRPAACPTIVANVMSAANLMEQHYVLRYVHRITDSLDRMIEWLAAYELLNNSHLCCNVNMGYVARQRCSDGRAWYCKYCKSIDLFQQIRFLLTRICHLVKLLNSCIGGWILTQSKASL